MCTENRFFGPMAQPWSVEGWWSVVFFTSFHYCRFRQEFLRLFLLPCLRAPYHYWLNLFQDYSLFDFHFFVSYLYFFRWILIGLHRFWSILDLSAFLRNKSLVSYWLGISSVYSSLSSLFSTCSEFMFLWILELLILFHRIWGAGLKRRVRVLCLSGEKIDITSDSLKVVDGVEVDEDDAGVA